MISVVAPLPSPLPEIAQALILEGAGRLPEAAARYAEIERTLDVRPPPEGEPQLSQGSAAVGECFQKCIVDSCPNVTEVLFPELVCTALHCRDECESYGATCTACVIANCKAELDLCQALSCSP